MCIICDGEDITGYTELDISGCPFIDTIPELPSGLISLNCSGCSSLESIPKLPETLEDLDCSLCDNLKELQSLPRSLLRLNCSGCIELLDLNYRGQFSCIILEDLDCSDCSNLISLPKLPETLKDLNCYNCPKLTVLSYNNKLPHSLLRLNCSGCTGLNSLPTLPSLINLICYDCTSLIELPILPHTLKRLDCSNCISLSVLPELPNLEVLICNICNIIALPELPDSLIELKFSGCKNIEFLPKLPKSLSVLECSEDFLNPESRDRYLNFKQAIKLVEKAPLDTCLVLNFPDPVEFTIFSSYMAGDVNMKEYLEEDKENFCFITVSNYRPSKGSFVGFGCSLDQLNIKENIIVECNGMYGGMITRDRVNWDKFYAKIGIDQTNSGILLAKLNSIPKKIREGYRIFFLSKPRVLAHVATVKNVVVSADKNMYGETVDYVSGNHCNEGSSSAIYGDVSIADINTLKGMIDYSGHKTLCV